MKNKKLLIFVLLSFLGVSTALACGWNFLTDHSVRFNSMRTGRGFYRLPPLPIEYNPATGKELTTVEIEQYIDYDSELDEGSKPLAETPGEIWTGAVAAIESNNVRSAADLFGKFLEASQYKLYWETHDERQEYGQSQRNSAADILDAIGAKKEGASDEGVVAYAKARLAGNEATIPTAEDIGRTGRSLQDNWAYLRAATLYNSGKRDEALIAFEEHDRAYPRSEKNEAVLYMIGKLLMERGDAVQRNCAGDCSVPEWDLSVKQFKRLQDQYPKGRYVLDARGWLGHLYRHQGKTAEALAEYYRLLGNSGNHQWRLDAKKSLQIMGHKYDDATLDRVETMISNEPETALTYAYHRIYNHAVDHSYEEFDEWCCASGYGSDFEEEKKRVRTSKNEGRHELERIAKFATAIVKRYGKARVSGDFLLRVAQAQIELENFGEALTFADKAIKSGVTSDSRAQTLWIKGSSEHQLRKLSAAKVSFKTLIAEFPKHKLTEGAQRLLAVTAEDQDDLESALDLYFDLGYQNDVAYFVDVLLPTDRLAQYVAERRSNLNYPILLYSLGVRYMRDKRWAEARETLSRVKTEKSRDDYLNDERHPTRFFPKEPSYTYGENKVSHIKTSWVMQDLRTIDAIEYRESELQRANGSELRAEALYQLASTYFELDDLAFYNPAMWHGGRTGSLGQLQFSSHERLPNETRTIFDHLQIHDPWAKSIPIYEAIVAEYPDSKIARDALYTIAVAHEKLEGRNSVWSEIYRRGLFAGPRMVTYKDVRNIFPDYQLPRGTYGWKPSTRTVDGGRGWDPKPKPLPRLSTEQRVVRKVEKWADKYGGTVWEKTVAVKNAIRDAAVYVSGAIAGYVQNHFYLVYAGFLGAIVWANRKEIYDGPVTKGSFLAHRGLIFIGEHLRDWWVAVAIPSVIRVNGTESGKKEESNPP